jgi:GH15 family glucan-1,4-alpha-glucosidase
MVTEQRSDPNPPIDDYALIGDGRSAALVARDGSLDWLCWPRFDSPSVFSALLDTRRGGRFQIRPIDAYGVERRYLPDTNVLETVFHTATGSVALRDVMTIASEEFKRVALMAEHEVLRQVECLTGDVEMEVVYEPRPGYGRDAVHLEQRKTLGLWSPCGKGALTLRSDAPLRVSADGQAATGRFNVQAGQQCSFSLTYSRDAPAVLPLLGREAHARIEQSARWWGDWAGRCIYDGPHRDAVVRSALALKLMVYAPSGAVIAAPTTSLPERIGGERNWDYRYCWLRDASFTLRALLDLGYDEEATAYVSWLLHTTRLTWPKLQVLYDVFGEAQLPERELPHLSGYAESRPVRIGNDAHGQLQLDVYGEVLDAAAQFARRGGRFDHDTVRYLNGLGLTVCETWRYPDEGIWEGRSGRAHHTHSKVLCWVALDRLIELHETRGLMLDVDRFRHERDAIRDEVERRGYNTRIGSYTQVFDGEDVDASALTFPLYGYIDATHPRMTSTCTRIHQVLGRDGLVFRYAEDTADGLPPGEGTFGVCGFWAVECRARGGDVPGAAQAFEHLLASANDVGLYAEETDPDTGAALGNFPQAFTHVGLINAALTLSSVGAGANPLATAAREILR